MTGGNKAVPLMESDSSAQSLLSLFSTSKLKTFTPPTSRTFYETNSPPPPTIPPTSSSDQSRKRLRPSANAGEWTSAEIRALDSYRNLIMNDEDINGGLKDVLLPNRTEEEVRLKLASTKRTGRVKRMGSKLEDLEKSEREQFEKEEKVRLDEMEDDYMRRRNGLDAVLGLSVKMETEVVDDDQEDPIFKMESKDVKSTLDQVLGLSGESEEHRRKQRLDEALGLL